MKVACAQNKPLISENKFRAICRKTGVRGLFVSDDNADTLEVDGVFDEVDSEVALQTGIAAGTPVFETYTEWVGTRFDNGDFLTIDGTRFMIRGAVMVDTAAGTSLFTLTRRAS